jgi:hypothetical protein
VGRKIRRHADTNTVAVANDLTAPSLAVAASHSFPTPTERASVSRTSHL